MTTWHSALRMAAGSQGAYAGAQSAVAVAPAVSPMAAVTRCTGAVGTAQRGGG
jgi:hypothetical protein